MAINLASLNINNSASPLVFAAMQKAQPREDIDTLFEREKQKEEPQQANSLIEKLLNYSKVVFSRESTYRGFVDLFAEDTPSLLIEAMRGKAAFFESLFNHVLATGMIFILPVISKFYAKKHAKEIFGDEDGERNYANYMLFSRHDLDSTQTMDESRSRIIKEEVQDKINIAKTYGFSSAKAEEAKNRAKNLEGFMNKFQANDDLRSKLLDLKDRSIKSQMNIQSAFWGGLPLIRRFFRKYVMGIDRFVGSMKYLNDKDADRLGNVKGISFKQLLGTAAAIFAGPQVVKGFLHMIKGIGQGQGSGFASVLKNQIDLKHSFYPKLGLFMSFGEIPYLTSKLVNSQDMFEMIENLIKYFVTAGSLLFGDRATNGRIAKNVDPEFTSKHGLESGLFYHKEEGSGFWASLKTKFPEAAKFQHVLDRTKHDPELEKEATGIYQKTFFKGFALHAIGTFFLKWFINWTTKTRVSKALKKADGE